MLMQNAIIFGDSYSTFEGFVPKGYPIHYYKDKRNGTDVEQVSHTWWHQVAEEANLNLVLNDSWSGSTIGYTGYNNADCSKTNSFIYRLKQLIEKGFFAENQIDTVFVFGGTNDSWAEAPLGEIKYGDWAENELYFVLPAICYFLNLVRETLPQANIYCIINTEIKPEIISCFEKACEKYQVCPVAFDSIDKDLAHPTIKGMQTIKDGVLRAMGK